MFTPTIKYKRVNEASSVTPIDEPKSTIYNYSSATNDQHNHINSSKEPHKDPVKEATILDTNTPAPVLQDLPATTTTTISSVSTTPKTTSTTPAFTFEEKEEATITVDPNDDERILITLSDGTTQYTADRYCPHAGADLSYLGQVDEDEYPPEIGPILLCTLHYWEYALKKQGRGANGVATINACPAGGDTTGLDCPAKKGLDW